MNHFASCCRKMKGRVRLVKESFDNCSEAGSTTSKISDQQERDSCDSSEDSYDFHLQDRRSVCHMQEKQAGGVYVDVKIVGKKIRLQIDSGSDKNVLSESDYQAIKSKVRLEKTKLRLYPYNSKKPLPLLGKFTADIQGKYRYSLGTFYVAKGIENKVSLMCLNTAVELGAIKVMNNLQDGRDKEEETTEDESINRLVTIYKNKGLFNGVGRLKNF